MTRVAVSPHRYTTGWIPLIEPSDIGPQHTTCASRILRAPIEAECAGSDIAPAE